MTVQISRSQSAKISGQEPRSKWLAAADDDARVVVRVDHRQGCLFDAQLHDLARFESREFAQRVDLGERRLVVVADRQVQERLHAAPGVGHRRRVL